MQNTISQKTDAVGFTRGFDYLRIILAFGVVAWHSIYVSGNGWAKGMALGDIFGPFKAAVLPMFFSLSGFLVAGSIFRSKTLTGFVTLRIVRIMPALAVEVLLSALILGPLVTELPLQLYFTDMRFWTYLLNVFGEIHYYLPGVFEHNPRPGIVNLSLWTVPFELGCYATLVTLLLVGLHRKRGWFATIAILSTIGVCLYDYLAFGGAPKFKTMTFDGLALVSSFLLGCAIYLWRDRIRLSAIGAALCGIAGFVLLSFPQTMVLSALPLAYATVYLGMLNPPKVPVLMDGDYSYGVYLFAYPIQQLLAMFDATRPWHINLALTAVLSLLYAAFSWHCVEKPVLSRKKTFVAVAERLVAACARPFTGKQGKSAAQES